jgi:peptide/nickel transport system permease protein
MAEDVGPLNRQELRPEPGGEGKGKELLYTAASDPFWVALQRFRRNTTSLAFGVLFLAIVASCLLAPVYARYVAHTGPDQNHVTETIRIGGRNRDVVSLVGIPIGPTWQSRFFFGADLNGRDEAVRLLYGGRNSLIIGLTATAITMFVGVLIALVGGYYRNWVDGALARLLDLIWAFPAVLLGVAIGASLALGGISIGPIAINGDSLFIPALIIGFVNIPYVAKPVRGQVVSLRESEFVDAARILDAGSTRIMFTEILPNLSSTILVLIPLMIANSILLEAALSYLGAGVQAPNASWGTMISDGVQLITSSPHLVLVPGLTLVLTVFSINVFGEGLRDAVDPRGTARGLL